MIQQNDGSHSDGGIGIGDDRLWQRLHRRIASCNLALYDLPNGRWADRFLTLQAGLWEDARLRKCNSEKPLIFAACILRKVKNVKRFAEVKPLIWQRMNVWEEGRFVGLVKGVEEEAMICGFGTGRSGEFAVESAARRYNSMVLSGKVRAAVRMVTERDPGGLFRPSDLCSKTGRLVMDVLRDKHPTAVVPPPEDFDTHPDPPDLWDTPQLHCYEEQVAKAVARLSGGAGPCGVDGIMLRSWMLRHGAHSERLRVELAKWVGWLSNGSPPYAAYRALNTVRELAADKRPGVRPRGCGETWMRLIANCNLMQSREMATAACGNTQLCAGLRSGIEASLHAVRAIWPQSAGWLDEQASGFDDSDGGEEEGAGNANIATNDPRINREAEEDTPHSQYTPGTGFGTALFDARNAFQELNRYLMLWNVAHLWPRGSRFAFNRYRHWGICLVRDDPGKEAQVIHSKEGITQGDCFAMNLYGVALLPLAEAMKTDIPSSLQPWYADDTGAAGEAASNAECLRYLLEHGPRYGYFVEPSKSTYICKLADEVIAREAFESRGLDIGFSQGERYLGGFIGSAVEKERWLGEVVAKWTAAVETLALVAEKFPQTAYAGFTFCLQNEWQYLQRVVADTGSFFAPLETAIRRKFIPALLGIGSWEIDGDYRELLTHSVKKGGLALRNPVDTACYVHDASKQATIHLTESLVDSSLHFDLGRHVAQARVAGQMVREARLGREQQHLNERGTDAPAVKRRDLRGCAAGVWLTVMPNRLNGTSISAEEWRDNVRLRYNHVPQDMPHHCDGCGMRMTVEHALSCKTGGLVHIRHDDVAGEWSHLCALAFSDGRVEREPKIYSSVGRLAREVGDTVEGTGEQGTVQITEERGDVGCHGFWQRGRFAIFDVRITDTEARSARGRDFLKVLAAQEKEKKDKYLDSCLQQRKDFTPLVYSVDGIAGREARNAEKRIAALLAAKWRKQYSTMVQYVRVRMSLAVVRANSLLIRGCRERRGIVRPRISDGYAMFDWHTWSDGQ